MTDNTPTESELLDMLPDTYFTKDISEELYREVVLPTGDVYRIDNPKTLVTRIGGSTHRVVDAQGITHCYADPSVGMSVIRWKARPGTATVRF